MKSTRTLRAWLSLRLHPLAAVALAHLLAGCVATGAPVRLATTPAPTATPREAFAAVRPPAKPAPRIAQLHMLPGLEGVIGVGAAELTRQFGRPRLEVWEGDARKLQFTGSACVLDVYLYPGARGNELQATHVDARRPSDGREVDRATCVAGLRTPVAAPAQP
ncbi:MAG: hypothetical protein ABIT04_05565 [Novosphingobium sp.]